MRHGAAAALRGRHLDLYSTLGCAPSASTEEILVGYRRAALAAHPERGGSPEALAEVNAAFAVLGDPTRRAVYDRYGEQGVRAMEGQLVDPGAFFRNVRDGQLRLLLAVLVGFLTMALLSPLLLSIRWDAAAPGRTPTFSWVEALVPLWLLEAAALALFMRVTQLQRLDLSDPEVDTEARVMWHATQKRSRRVRGAAACGFFLAFLSQLLTGLRLDGAISAPWSVTLLPLTLLLAALLGRHLYEAPRIFVHHDASFRVEDPDGNLVVDPEWHRSDVLASKRFWKELAVSSRWLAAAFFTSLLTGIVADRNDAGGDASFFVAAAPALVVLLAGLVMRMLKACADPQAAVGGAVVSQAQDPADDLDDDGEDEDEGKAGQGDGDGKHPSARSAEATSSADLEVGSQKHDDANEAGAARATREECNSRALAALAVLLNWLCTSGWLLLLVCGLAGKLSSVDAFSAFAFFVPILLFSIFLVLLVACQGHLADDEPNELAPRTRA